MDQSIVFFGSGPVAAESLLLIAKKFKIETVITKPKPPQHRGNFPVLDVAQTLNLPILTVTNKQQLDNIIGQSQLKSRVGVVVDFGIIISQEVIDYFPLGIINSHFSLLPEWRGADPISFAILSGQLKTGVSLMIIDPTLDTGKLITHKSLAISSKETTPTLTEKLIELSDELLGQYLPLYVNGKIKPRNQPHPDRATYSRKLTKEDGVIDWTKPVVQIEREIRAYIEWPKSRTEIAGKDIVITDADTIDQKASGPGQVTIENKALIIGCGEGALLIKKLKPAGKNEMSGEAFIAGHKKLLV